MANEFLERELLARENIVREYDVKVAVVEEKKEAYEQAVKELEELGNVDKAKSEIEEIKQLIEKLNPKPVETHEVEEQPVEQE